MNKHLPPSNIIEISAIRPAEKFIVFCGKREPWIDGDAMDRAEVINQVSSGEYNDLRQIVAFSLEAGTCRDATPDICGTVIQRWAQDGKLLSEKEKEFVALVAGERVANAFRMEEA
jgi:hypothetical protein